MNRERSAELLSRMGGCRVMVIGDYCLDEYIVGQAERLSREGPVPVLGFRRRFCLPGGAGNPVRNVSALGAAAFAVGVVGADDAAGELKELLERGGLVDTSGLVTDPSRTTTVKTRIVAEGLSSPQQVARIDRQDRRPVTPAVSAEISAHIARLGSRADAILVSHYRSGVAEPDVCSAARAAVAMTGAWLTVDAQGDLDRFHDFHLVRVGRQDAAESLGAALQAEEDYRLVANRLLESLSARVIVLGRGADGMSIAYRAGVESAESGESAAYLALRPTNVSEVFDVSGAGDTVIAVTTLALAAGATVVEAVTLANVAAGIVVRRLGVAAPTAAEIVAEWPS